MYGALHSRVLSRISRLRARGAGREEDSQRGSTAVSRLSPGASFPPRAEWQGTLRCSTKSSRQLPSLPDLADPCQLTTGRSTSWTLPPAASCAGSWGTAPRAGTDPSPGLQSLLEARPALGESCPPMNDLEGSRRQQVLGALACFLELTSQSRTRPKVEEQPGWIEGAAGAKREAREGSHAGSRQLLLPKSCFPYTRRQQQSADSARNVLRVDWSSSPRESLRDPISADFPSLLLFPFLEIGRAHV